MSAGKLIEINSVFRDSSQGLFGNRIPVDHPDILRAYEQWDKLTKLESDSPTTSFSAIEVGGAHPQVYSVFLNENFLESIRQIRAASPNAVIRPLWRGANGFMLAPKSIEELRTVLKAVANASAGPHLTNQREFFKNGKELLRIKAFDSQGDNKEVESSINMVAQLRAEGYPIGIEIAVPYSNNKGCEPNEPYSDEMYVKKIVNAAKMAKEKGIPEGLYRVSLKDMVGELDATDATRLITKIIKELKAKNINIRLGLHLHNTGLAAEAYAAAISVCKRENYPIAIDTVEGKETGFASTLEVHEQLIKNKDNVGLSLSGEQIFQLKEIGKQITAVEKTYSMRRVGGGLTGQELRNYKLPGGGQASFATAVKSMGLASSLGLTEGEAQKVAGEALRAVSRLMGYPFAVTPGFQNKQLAALNLLTNMVEQKYLRKEEKFDAIIGKVLAKLTDKQVRDFFIKGWDPRVREFLRGEMPMQSNVHPQIAAELRLDVNESKINQEDGKPRLGKRDKVLTYGLKPDLDSLRAEAEKLYKEGHAKPTRTQLDAAIRLHPKSRTDAGNSAKQMVIEDLMAICVILGDTKKLRNKITKPWLKEPDASQYYKKAIAQYKGDPKKFKESPEYASGKEEYERDLAKFQSGLSYGEINDDVEKIRAGFFNDLKQGKADLAKTRRDIEHLLIQERLIIQNFVFGFITSSKNVNLVGKAAADLSKLSNPRNLQDLVEAVYNDQKNIIMGYEDYGRKFLLPETQRLDVAMDALYKGLKIIATESSLKTERGFEDSLKQAIQTKRDNIENASVVAITSGVIVSMNPKLFSSSGKLKEGVEVKKGEVLFVTDAMKTQTPVKATKDGKIAKLNFKIGDQANKGQAVIEYRSEKTKDSPRTPVVIPDIHNGIEKIHVEISENKAKIFSSSAKKSPRTAPVANSHASYSSPELSSRGYTAHKLSIDSRAIGNANNVVHIIGNRAGCAAKILGDLKQAGYNDVRVLYTEGDASTPIIKNASAGEIIKINKYDDADEIIRTIENAAKAEPSKKIVFHPGWGFLSENHQFVAKFEALKKTCRNIIFAGPPSKPMETAGGKFTFRQTVGGSGEGLNPGYFGNTPFSSAQLKAYVDSGFSNKKPHDTVDAAYRKHFAELLAIGGDVMIKAVSGGGGRGIVPFKINAKPSYADAVTGKRTSDESEYRRYVTTVANTVAVAEQLFNDGTVMTESRVRGKTHHFEVQFASNNGQAITLGARNCSAQNNGQKFIEMNILGKDYHPESMAKIMADAKIAADRLAAKGYTGLGTLEMLLVPDPKDPSKQKAVILETNTRLQVEHGVTEEDIFLKTGKRISLPVLNACLAMNPKVSPIQALNSLFGLAEKDLSTINTPGDQRVLHFRVNSKSMDFAKGTSLPTRVSDARWLSPELTAQIAKKHNVTILQGGLGGNYDSQIGAILGTAEAARKAAKELNQLFELSQVFDRFEGENAPNLQSSLQWLDSLLLKDGRANPNFSTATADDFLKDVESGKKPPLRANVDKSIWPGQAVLEPGSLDKAAVGSPNTSVSNAKAKGPKTPPPPAVINGRDGS